MNNCNLHFVTYGDESYTNAKKRILVQAKDMKRFCEFHIYGRENLDQDFIKATSPFINLKRGGGYWIWKPYCVNKCLDKIEYGDYLLYADVGCTFRTSGIKRFDEYLDLLDKDKNQYGCLSFEIEEDLFKWNKEEVYDYFKIQKNDPIRNTKQLSATCFIIKKTKHSEKLIKEWLHVALTRPDLFSDNINQDQDKDFIENRHDQTIFDLIRKKYGSIVLPQEQEFPNEDSTFDKFPICATRIGDKLRDFQIHQNTVKELQQTQGQLQQTENNLLNTQTQLQTTQNTLHETQQYLRVNYTNNSLKNIIKTRLREKLVHPKWAKYPRFVRFGIYSLKLCKLALKKIF